MTPRFWIAVGAFAAIVVLVLFYMLDPGMTGKGR